MSETINEFHLCICGKGDISVKKLIVSRRGSQSQPKEVFVSIIPCRSCGSTINCYGIELDKRKKIKKSTP